MSHIELLECGVGLHEVAATAAPRAGPQETEAFEWVMGSVRRMERSWSLMVIYMRLRVLMTAVVVGSRCRSGCRPEVCRTREKGRRRRRSQPPGSGLRAIHSRRSRWPLSRRIGRGLIVAAVTRGGSCIVVRRGGIRGAARRGSSGGRSRRPRVGLRLLTPSGIRRRSQ